MGRCSGGGRIAGDCPERRRKTPALPSILFTCTVVRRRLGTVSQYPPVTPAVKRETSPGSQADHVRVPAHRPLAGARPGAGRKRVRKSRVPHRTREAIPKHCPVLVTLRVREDVPPLRRWSFARAFRDTLRQGIPRRCLGSPGAEGSGERSRRSRAPRCRPDSRVPPVFATCSQHPTELSTLRPRCRSPNQTRRGGRRVVNSARRGRGEATA